nr:hypothetical protein [Angustibacter aerolatus]
MQAEPATVRRRGHPAPRELGGARARPERVLGVRRLVAGAVPRGRGRPRAEGACAGSTCRAR